MVSKLITTIIVLSLAALELLVLRQEQINTVHAMTQLHRDIEVHIAIIDSKRIEIEFACSPSVLNAPRMTADANDGIK